ncbi:MAG: immunoglobulin domain-containing protein [Verrucomicrobia bacterium]|nr:immunoglobulin domain-containing protein [Verrucomicrobiota bacterium]
MPIASWDWPTLDGPLVNRVMGPGTAISAGGAFVGPPGTMYVASGPNGTPRVFGVVRFTVPPGESGQYRMVATVAPVFDGDLSADADFHVMKGEQELFGVSLPPNTPSGYINELALEAGQVLDFAVGRGADGVALRSALKLALTIVRTDVTGAAPVIVQQPLSQSVRVGETARFAVEATGDPPLAYIWLFNSEPIAGATASVLELANVQLAQAGNYSVIATNDFGFAVSETASLTVEEPPPVRTYDLSADYTLASNPNGPWSYGAQEALGGAFSLLAHARTFPADNGVPIASWDWAGGVSPLVNRVMGPGTAVSAGGAFVGPPGTIYFVPGPDGTARNFGVIRFTVPPQQSGQYRIEAAVSPLFDGELSADCDFHVMKGEQELFGMSLPPNTSSGYTNELALEVGQALDFAIGRGADGLAARSGLKIALRMIRTDVPGAPPTITLQPQSQTVVQGATATFAVAATGDAPLAYVWLFNGEPVAGATASVLELANVQPAQAGGYFVVVSNEWGHAVSDVATLTVTPGPACAAPLESLVSWWAGEGNGVDQQGTNHGALMGGVTFADGQVGAAFNFVGTGHVRVVRSDTLNVGTGPGLTLEGWIKPSDTANGHVIAEWNRGVGDVVPGVAFWLGHPSLPPGVLIGTIADGSGGWPYVQSPAGAVVPGVWQHVALTYDRGSGNARLFVNGVEVAAKGVGSFIPETSHDLYFGIRPPGSYAYRGLMDEMSLYNGALSATELAAIVAAGSAGKCSSEAAPVIVEQPRDRRVALGEAAEFSVSAGGTRPLGYQWRFNGSALPDATNATLILPAVAFTDTGTYSVVVSNAFGIAVSDDAMLTVLPPPSRVAVVSSGARSGSAFDLPIQLVAFGNENALGFSLQFDPGLLEFLGVLPGPETPADSSLVTNTNDAAAGRVGMALALPAGTAFNAGTQQVLAVRFQAPDVTSPVTVPVAFGDVPTLRQVADALAQPLPAVFTAGEVRVERIAFEADVAPRPGGDQILSVIDWVQVGRFVAGLDTPEGDEFQRADCAPMDTAGNGVLSVTDWVQAGRYAIGATPPIAAGGPESPEPENPAPAAVPAAASPRALRLPDVTAAPGTVVTVAVRCDAAGNENALGFSVAFDPATLAWVGAAPGPGAAGATWYVNSASLPDGVVGFVLALPAGVTLEPGASDVAHFSFRVRATATGSSALAFADQPILREVSDPMAEAVACDYAAGSVTVDNSIAVGPPLGFRRSGSSLVLFWPVNGLAYDIEVASSGLDGGWQRLDVDPVLIDDQNIVILTVADATHAFYRLRQR